MTMTKPNWWQRLLSGFKRETKVASREKPPLSLLDLRGDDLCWCGSERTYRDCHQREDRERLFALTGLKGRLETPFL